MKITVFADPGHAWGKVKIELLKKLGIADQISSCSYIKGDYAYLEEDCDLARFVRAAKAAGMAIEFNESHADKRSRIRSYESYPPSYEARVRAFEAQGLTRSDAQAVVEAQDMS